MQALRNGVKSLRSDVSTPCWVETGEAGRIGAAEGISGRVIFADFSSRTPGKIYRKNSDSPLSEDLAIKIFPAMFVSAALIFAAISFILFWALKGKTMLYVLMVVLGIPALLISFIYQKVLTILPDNN
ncbi:MAG: hypothetical protein WCH01_22385 [Methylococcaceae bacterium]